MILRNIKKFILDLIFPIKCISCKKNGKWICEKCFSQIKITTQQVCGICEKMITPDGRTCLNCNNSSNRQTGKSHIDGILTCASYKQACISRAVHLFKYQFIDELAIPLGDLMVNVLRKTDIPLPDLILPIPLHQRRLRWRGFNQSLLLAQQISRNLLSGTILPLKEKILLRNRYTTPQMSIKDHKHRKENLREAFSISKSDEVAGKIILLVDDIATTGSTIFECAKVLKNSGAKEVFAIVIARQEKNIVKVK